MVQMIEADVHTHTGLTEFWNGVGVHRAPKIELWEPGSKDWEPIFAPKIMSILKAKENLFHEVL